MSRASDLIKLLTEKKNEARTQTLGFKFYKEPGMAAYMAVITDEAGKPIQERNGRYQIVAAQDGGNPNSSQIGHEEIDAAYLRRCKRVPPNYVKESHPNLLRFIKGTYGDFEDTSWGIIVPDADLG